MRFFLTVASTEVRPIRQIIFSYQVYLTLLTSVLIGLRTGPDGSLLNSLVLVVGLIKGRECLRVTQLLYIQHIMSGKN